jgi:hypothetical protein
MKSCFVLWLRLRSRFLSAQAQTQVLSKHSLCLRKHWGVLGGRARKHKTSSQTGPSPTAEVNT